MSYYYVTVATKEGFIKKYTRYAVKSLLKAGVKAERIHLVGNTRDDTAHFNKYIPEIKNVSYVGEDISAVKWKSFGGIRKYSLVKAAGLYKSFPNPRGNDCMIYFDGDVLWYNNPDKFFKKYDSKTWFHHGKDLAKRSKLEKEKVDIKDIDSLKKWVSLPCAYLMIEHGATKLPDREVVAGLYLLHPRDHADVLRLTYEYCVENSNKFVNHEGAGDQKPMNAALNILDVDWHGGSRFLCPEHEGYFDHFFGKQDRKKEFWRRAERMGL